MHSKTKQHVNARWVAGQIGCSQLAVGLQRALAGLSVGERVEVITHNEGAEIDIPAWCHITGHQLLTLNHPVYIIQKQGDQHV